MDPTCISAAAVLRCSSLTRGQNIALIVPVAMEFLASCFLIFFKWGSGKQHLLLVAEGWIYFILALVELCSVIPSLSKDNVKLFRSFDLGIGISSFLPLVFYTFYLYLFTRKELLENLPKYVIKVAQASLFLALPLIIATNEVASVSRITITFDPTGKIPSLEFTKKHGEWLWLFFTALTLAMLTAYQAIVFSLAFFRLIWILVQKRRGQHDTRIRGIGWISGGVKLGALEAIIGFAGGRFDISMTRRIMRFLGRACLCIGVIIGVDPAEETQRSYNNLEAPKRKSIRRQTHRSLRKLISDPRFSTFQELSPMATGFHAAHLAAPLPSPSLQTSSKAAFKPPHYLPYSQRQRNERAISRYASLLDTNPNQRVTVLWDQDGPPLLQMRFSVLGVPLTPTLEQGNNKLRFPEPTRGSSWRPPTIDEDDPLPLPNAPFALEEQRNSSNRVSGSSVASSMVEIIDVPRRTISQRVAAARVFRARTWDDFEKASKDTSDISDSDNLSSRTPTPGPLLSISLSHHLPSNLVHTHTDSQSVSLKSISDSIQAVQELASQFPTLPPASPVDHSLDFATPASLQSGHFVFAIGSPSDLEPGSSDLPTEVSHDDASHRGLLVGHPRLSADIGRTSRQEYANSSARTSRDTTVTIKQSIVPVDHVTMPLMPTTLQGPSRPVGFGNPFAQKPSGDDMRISEWVDDPPNKKIVPQGVPQSVDNRGVAPIQSRVAGPRTMGKIPIPNRSSLKDRIGSHMKPIVIPSRKANLPKAVQYWEDDGAPLT